MHLQDGAVRSDQALRDSAAARDEYRQRHQHLQDSKRYLQTSAMVVVLSCSCLCFDFSAPGFNQMRVRVDRSL
jgi:hypothetical protein